MEPLDDWKHVEKGLVNSKKRAWSLAKPSEAVTVTATNMSKHVETCLDLLICGFYT